MINDEDGGKEDKESDLLWGGWYGGEFYIAKRFFLYSKRDC